MTNIALIKKNLYTLELPEINDIYNKPKHDLTQIKEKIKLSIIDLVEFIEIESNSLMENIVSHLDYEHGDNIDTETLLENKTNVFQICYKLNEDLDSSNSLSCILSRKTIFGKTIVIANEYDDDKYKLCSVTLDHIVDIIMDKIYAQCIFITENGDMTEYYFKDIKEITSLLLKSETINKYEIEISGFKLDIYNTNVSTLVDSSIKNNITGTRLVGDFKIKGDIIVVYTIGSVQGTQIQLCDGLILSRLYIDELKKLELLSLGSMEDRKLIVRSNEYNRYTFINKLYNNYKHKCINCDNTANLKRCTKCYRILACSDECFKKYYKEHHKNDCINN